MYTQASLPFAPLTCRQRDALKALRSHMERHGWPPTVRELAAALGVSSPRAAARLLEALEDKGYILRRPGLARGIALCIPSPAESPPAAFPDPIPVPPPAGDAE